MLKMTLPKIYHKFDKVSAFGAVSALCFPIPRSIDLKKELWTIRDEAVTCPKCLKILAFQKANKK